MTDKDLRECGCEEEKEVCDCEHEHNHDHHGHDHDENCGCGHDHDDMEDFEIITLTLDDDTELECAVLNVFDVDGVDYISLLPLDDEDIEDKEVLLYRFNELSDEEIEIKMIETEEEFGKVATRYYELNSEDEE